MKRFRKYFTVLILLLLISCATAGEVRLAWDPSVSEGVVGYRIHYGTSSGNYTNVIDVGATTTHKVTGLKTGDRFYFVADCYDDEGTIVGAYDPDDNVSAFSNEVSGTAVKTVRILAAPVLRIEVQ